MLNPQKVHIFRGIWFAQTKVNFTKHNIYIKIERRYTFDSSWDGSC